MTSLERVLTAIGQKEPDRVPLFLLLSLHGAKELGVSLKDYFSKAENIAEAQVKMRKKYDNDCINAFFYAAVETEAFGGDVIFIDNGPPNAGQPIINRPTEIPAIKVPEIKDSPSLLKVLKAIRLLKAETGNDAPIIGVVMSPFSLPVMQMGFDRYLDLMHKEKFLFDELMRINEEFCVAWANAQLEAGATAICYFDPVSSSTIIPPMLYRETGWKIAKNTISRINGPTATHFASGRCLPIIDDIAETGTAIIGVSALEDIADIKKVCNKRLSVLGNLNGIEMCRWTEEETGQTVKNIITKAGNGGGLILSDNHGEIPYQVTDKTLHTISAAVKKWGTYPLRG